MCILYVRFADQEHRLNISYSQAQDYPIDLYYLMDLSKSMDDDKKTLSKLGNKLTEEMQKISSNFRLGFGSFVDKVLMPYVSTVPDKWVFRCAVVLNVCEWVLANIVYGRCKCTFCALITNHNNLDRVRNCVRPNLPSNHKHNAHEHTTQTDRTKSRICNRLQAEASVWRLFGSVRIPQSHEIEQQCAAIHRKFVFRGRRSSILSAIHFSILFYRPNHIHTLDLSHHFHGFVAYRSILQTVHCSDICCIYVVPCFGCSMVACYSLVASNWCRMYRNEYDWNKLYAVVLMLYSYDSRRMQHPPYLFVYFAVDVVYSRCSVLHCVSHSVLYFAYYIIFSKVYDRRVKAVQLRTVSNTRCVSALTRECSA